MLVRKVIDLNAPLELTPEQKAELEVLRQMSDDDIDVVKAHALFLSYH